MVAEIPGAAHEQECRTSTSQEWSTNAPQITLTENIAVH